MKNKALILKEELLSNIKQIDTPTTRIELIRKINENIYSKVDKAKKIIFNPNEPIQPDWVDVVIKHGMWRGTNYYNIFSIQSNELISDPDGLLKTILWRD